MKFQTNPIYTTTPSISDIERFARRFVIKENGCWRWIGQKIWSGYSVIWYKDRSVSGHRFSYIAFGKKLTPGLALDHLCRNRDCVNPKHLEEVTFKENVMRGEGLAKVNAQKTNCPKGHLLDKINKQGRRVCTICQREKGYISYLKRSGKYEQL